MSPGSRDFGRGVLLTVSGTVLVSFEALFLRLLDVDIWTVIWWRGLLLGIAALAVLSITGLSLQTRRLGFAGLAAIVAFSATIFFFILAINTTTVANTLVIASAAPLFAAVQSWLFLRERTARATWVAVAMLVVGIAIIFSGSLQTSFIAGDLFALTYAGCLAAYYVALRRCPGDLLLSIVFYGGLLSGLLAWPLAEPATIALSDVCTLLALGGIVVPASTILLSFGSQYIPAPQLTLIMMLEMILAPLWVWLAFDERPETVTFLGGVLVLTTVVWHSYVVTSSRLLKNSVHNYRGF